MPTTIPPIKTTFGLLLLLLVSGNAAALEVNITVTVDQFQVRHGEHDISILRNQDTDATIEFNFARTSRPCPPFCAQPMQLDKSVETIGEVELVAFMQGPLADGSGLLIDARTEEWHERGTIPGSINIPFNQLNPEQGADDLTLEDALARLDVEATDKGWNFSKAKHLVLWCNGPWCGQSPTAIKGLLSVGYPAGKIKYYRGGMQLWRIFGLPVVSPEGKLLDN